MKILLYGINYKPELTGIGKYSGEMAEWLSEHGCDIRVVSAPPYYPAWKIGSCYSKWFYSVEKFDKLKIIRCPLYVPRSPTLTKRLLHLLSFTITSFFGLLYNIRWKPDIIILVAPTLLCAPAALFFSKITGAKSVIHIQDYEVDAMFGLGMASSGTAKRQAFKVESYLLKKFDRLSTISQAMLQRAIDKGVPKEKTFFFPNWAEVSRFKDIMRDDDYLNSLSINDAKKVILYSGNMGEKQGLEVVVEAADILRNNSNIEFFMVGEGGGRKKLISMAENKKLTNMKFLPLQPYENLPDLLAAADCHLVVQRRGAADAVLPSKLTNILAVGGNAVITADEYTELGILCSDFPGIAKRVEPESSHALAEGILAALEMKQPNLQACSYAEKYLDKEQVLQDFLSIISR